MITRTVRWAMLARLQQVRVCGREKTLSQVSREYSVGTSASAICRVATASVHSTLKNFQFGLGFRIGVDTVTQLTVVFGKRFHVNGEG
jgi:hypothetical protein